MSTVNSQGHFLSQGPLSIRDFPSKLFFVRDLSKREIDFMIAKTEEPVMLIETKKETVKILGYTRNIAKNHDNNRI